jgi:ACS family hexuronate transporter-like MFS transporter
MNAAPASTVRNGGWLIVAMLAFSTFLNYVDRQTLSLLSRPIQDALLMDDKAYAAVVTSFMIAYTVGNVSSGILVDRLGAVRAMPVFVVLWSLAGALCGLADNSTHLGAARFFLGLFETGNFLAAPIIVSMFLPADQKAFGIGIYTAAAMLGAAVSPPLVTLVNELAGWRAAFMLMGGAGLIWAFIWWLLPTRDIGAQGKGEQEDARSDPPGAVDIQTWGQALTEPRVWAQALGTMLTFPVWFFYLNWFPKYLTDERGLSTLEMGTRAWVVYLFAGIGCMLAGVVIAALLRRTRLSALCARIWVMAAVAVLAPVGAINYFTPPVAVSLASAAWVALFHMIWQITVTSLPLELFTARSLGKVLGIVGIVSGIGGIVSTWLIGNLVSVVSFRPMFIVMASVYLIAMAVMLALYKRGGVRLMSAGTPAMKASAR